jgi:hypothetical protein
MNFEELNLAPAIVKAVREQGYETPTAIQAQAIPVVLEGHDLLAGAQTGTGKTAAFTLPMLHKLSKTAAKNATSSAGRHRRPGADAHPRAGRPGRGIGAALRQAPAAVLHRHLRRRRHEPADRAASSAASTSWWPPRAACWTCWARACWTWARCRSWCSTKPTACWTWASSTTSRRCWPPCPSDKQSLLFSATFSDEIRELAATLLQEPAERAGHAAQHHGAAHHAGDPPGGPRQEEGPAGPHHPAAQLEPGAGVHPHQVRRQQRGRIPDQERHPRDGAARQQEPGRAHPGPGRLQERRDPGPGGHRHRRPRHRHRRPAACGELRDPQRLARTTCTASAAPAVPVPMAPP